MDNFSVIFATLVNTALVTEKVFEHLIGVVGWFHDCDIRHHNETNLLLNIKSSFWTEELEIRKKTRKMNSLQLDFFPVQVPFKIEVHNTLVPVVFKCPMRVHYKTVHLYTAHLNILFTLGL